MTPTRSLFAAALAALTTLSVVHAQAPAIPPLPKPASPSAWRIDYTDSAQTPAVTSETFRVSGQTAEKTSALTSGSTAKSFLVGRYKLYTEEGRVFVLDLDPSKSEFAQQLFHREYPGLEWATPEHFVGFERIEGKTCALFREPPSPETGPLRREAYLLNGQPFLIRSGTLTGKYTFLEAPQEITLPPEFQTVLAKVQERRIPPGQARSISK